MEDVKPYGAAKYRFTAVDSDGCELEVSVPARFVVCSGCGGAGKHCNRAIDGNGLSTEDFENDPDFREDYMAGVYDVTCDTCGGDRVVAVPDIKRCTRAQKRQLVAKRRSEREYQRDYASERHLRMMESGERW